LSEISHDAVPFLRRDTERDAATRAAAVEAEHQPRMLRRAAVHPGIDAERPVKANDSCRPPFDMGEVGTPDQRPVAENPQFRHGPVSLMRRVRYQSDSP